MRLFGSQPRLEGDLYHPGVHWGGFRVWPFPLYRGVRHPVERGYFSVFWPGQFVVFIAWGLYRPGGRAGFRCRLAHDG